MVQSRSTRLRFLRRKQRLEPLPLRVCKFFSFHADECTPPVRVCKHALVLQLYLWNCTSLVVPILGNALMPAAPRRPCQNALHALLRGQHEAPEEASNLSDTQGYRNPRAALKAARLLRVGWDSVFFGAASIGSWTARNTVKSA